LAEYHRLSGVDAAGSSASVGAAKARWVHGQLEQRVWRPQRVQVTDHRLPGETKRPTKPTVRRMHDTVSIPRLMIAVSLPQNELLEEKRERSQEPAADLPGEACILESALGHDLVLLPEALDDGMQLAAVEPDAMRLADIDLGADDRSNLHGRPANGTCPAGAGARLF